LDRSFGKIARLGSSDSIQLRIYSITAKVMQNCLGRGLLLPNRPCTVHQITARKARAPLLGKKVPVCGIPDYKAPTYYGLPKNLDSIQGGTAGAGDPPPTPAGYASVGRSAPNTNTIEIQSFCNFGIYIAASEILADVQREFNSLQLIIHSSAVRSLDSLTWILRVSVRI